MSNPALRSKWIFGLYAAVNRNRFSEKNLLNYLKLKGQLFDDLNF